MTYGLIRCSMALKVITKESLWDAQREDLQTVMELVNVREHHARTFLIHYRWDVEKLITVYFEKGESRMFSEAGVNRDDLVVISPPQYSSLVSCNICLDEVHWSDMTRMSCGHSFCNNSTTTVDHRCNSYDEDKWKKSEHARRDLYRYLHYYNRYKAHTKSLKQESELGEMIEDKVSNLRARNFKLRDFSWVKKGFHRLLTSRRVLSYSYPSAFYVFGNDMTEKASELKQHFFEDHQQQLESNVEKLSQILEESFDEFGDEEEVRRIRIQVIDLTLITDSLCKRMYGCIENEILGSTHCSIEIIAPYRSKGIEKAGEVIAGWHQSK